METSALSDAELESELLAWAGRVAAGEAVVLRLLGEVEARGSWAQHGLVSCAHWVAWRLNLTLTTAREKVRVARALRGLPATSEAFSEGRVSYSQVRALTRVASAGDEQVWLQLARSATATQLEKAARGAERVRREQQRRENPEQVADEDRVRMTWDSDGTLVLTLRIPPGQAPVVMAALEQQQKLAQAEREARLAELATELAGEDPRASAEAPGAEVGDAEAPAPYLYVEPPLPDVPSLRGGRNSPEEERLMQAWWDEHWRRKALAQAWYDEQERREREAVAREVPTGRATLVDGLVRALTGAPAGPVTVQLLIDPVSGWARTVTDELLPPSAVRQALRAASAGLDRYDRGRRRREATPQLRALLGQLDGERCRFPGCSHTRFLHAHHVRWWSHGGRTDLENLVLVCSRHHQLIHDEGYRLRLDSHRVLHVRDRHGKPVLHRPPLVAGDAAALDPTGRITAETLKTRWTGERMDLGYVVSVLLAHAA